MNKKLIPLTTLSTLGLLMTTSAFADINTTFDAPPTMTSDVAATPAGVYETTSLTSLKASYVDFKLLVTANDLIPSELQQASASSSTGYDECIQLMVQIPKYVTDSITAANQAIAQSAKDDKTAGASGATQAQINLAKLEDAAAADAQTTITDANEVQHRLGLVQIYQITPPPATAQTPAEKLTLVYITNCAKNAGTDYNDANTWLVKARDAEASIGSYYTALPGQYKTAEWWVNASIQNPSQNANIVALADVKIYNASLGYIATDNNTFVQCSTGVTQDPIDAKSQLDLARQKLDQLKSSNGPGYQVPTDISTEFSDTDTSYQETVTTQTSIGAVVTEVDKKPWPTGCPTHPITNA